MHWAYIVLSLMAGVLLGMVFFGGLWWTVQRIAGSERPHLLLAASLALRAAIVMGGFYLLLMAGWHYLLPALIGFLAARTLLTHHLKPERGT